MSDRAATPGTACRASRASRVASCVGRRAWLRHARARACQRRSPLAVCCSCSARATASSHMVEFSRGRRHPAVRGSLRAAGPARAGGRARAHAHAFAARLGCDSGAAAGGRPRGARRRPARARAVRRRRRHGAAISRPCSATCRPPSRFSSRATTSSTGRIGIAGASLGREPRRARGGGRPVDPIARAALGRAATTRACGSRRRCGRWTGRCCSSPAPTIRTRCAPPRRSRRPDPVARRVTLPDAGHGTTMLVRQPDLAGRLVDWFRRTLL